MRKITNIDKPLLSGKSPRRLAGSVGNTNNSDQHSNEECVSMVTAEDGAEANNSRESSVTNISEVTTGKLSHFSLS